ncbi:hypothetical protein ACVWYH_008179 [Bradyrhizobium sp. GM24.11]
MKIIPIAVAFGGFAIAFSAVIFSDRLLSGWSGGAKCNDAAAVETLKSLAAERLSTSAEFLLKGGGPRDREEALKSLRNFGKPDLSVSAIRDRGQIGEKGKTCAATVTVLISSYASDLLTTYTVEPTTDGKTMVTARFQPNG